MPYFDENREVITKAEMEKRRWEYKDTHPKCEMCMFFDVDKRNWVDKQHGIGLHHIEFGAQKKEHHTNYLRMCARHHELCQGKWAMEMKFVCQIMKSGLKADEITPMDGGIICSPEGW